jgi:TonB family protein
MKKILVIDFDQGALASLQKILVEEGYQVVTAGDGLAGWEKFNGESPDLVLLEAMLPKVHGFELCQKITSLRNSRTPVFIMTGVYKDRVHRTEALRTYGAAEYFEKPLKMAGLLTAIEGVLGKPEKKPAEEPAPAAQTEEVRPEPVPVAPPKIDELKPAQEEFSYSADIDIDQFLKSERAALGKPEKKRAKEPAPAAQTEEVRPEPVPVAPPKIDKPKSAQEEFSWMADVDIDQFLESARAGLDLSNEKVKVPKTARRPQPPPAEKPRPVPPPVIVKPKPTPPHPPPAVAEKPAAERPWKAPSEPPAAVAEMPATERPWKAPSAPPPAVAEKPAAERPWKAPSEPPAAVVFPGPSVRFTRGDPGSDPSLFFSPARKKMEEPAEKPRTPVPPPAPKLPKREERAASTRPGTKAREAEVLSSSRIFSEVSGDRTKKAFSPLLAAGAAVAVIAVVGFFILRPKRPAAPADDGLKSLQTVTRSNVAERPAKVVPPPQVKPKPAAPRPKVITQTTVADIGPSSEDEILLPILPANTPLTMGNPPAPRNGQGQNAERLQAVQADPPPVKPEGSAPPVKTKETPTQGTAGDAGIIANSRTEAKTPAKPRVSKGDLVDLASVSEPPVTLKTVDPAYPPAAKRLGVEASITINVLINEKGNVIGTGILKGIKDDQGLGQAAETAVKKWKFKPANKDGVNVKVWKPFVIVFKAAGKTG